MVAQCFLSIGIPGKTFNTRNGCRIALDGGSVHKSWYFSPCAQAAIRIRFEQVRSKNSYDYCETLRQNTNFQQSRTPGYSAGEGWDAPIHIDIAGMLAGF
jgi:hypothetical protein